MRQNKIKQMWRDGKPSTLGWLSIAHSFSAELMARQGFDALCVDLQHGTSELERRPAHAAGRFADRHGAVRARRLERSGSHHARPSILAPTASSCRW